MNQNKALAIKIVSLVILSCLFMAIIEILIEPSYFIKSSVKIGLFVLLPLAFLKMQDVKGFQKAFFLEKTSFWKLLATGLAIYTVIVSAYFVTRGLFDFEKLVASLSSDQNIGKESFLPVAFYISFGNSFVEEFMFRFVSFLLLSEVVSKKTAYLFSSFSFAIYHVAMIASTFPKSLILISVSGLVVGGVIFNYLDDKNGKIYNAWIVHSFADFALMTIWYLHL